MGTIISAISMTMSIFCYSYCGKSDANISPLEKKQIEQNQTTEAKNEQ